MDRKMEQVYVSPDFDPNYRVKGPRRDRSKRMSVRMLVPFLARCEHCGESIARAKKFYMEGEKVQGMTYYGVPLWRFYFRCPQCTRTLSFRTDPATSQYVAEEGLHKVETMSSKLHSEKQERRLEGDVLGEGADASRTLDPMAVLESRTAENRRQLENMSALEALRVRAAAADSLDPVDVLHYLFRGAGPGAPGAAGASEASDDLTDDERAELARVFGADDDEPDAAAADTSDHVRNRVHDDPELLAALASGDVAAIEAAERRRAEEKRASGGIGGAAAAAAAAATLLRDFAPPPSAATTTTTTSDPASVSPPLPTARVRRRVDVFASAAAAAAPAPPPAAGDKRSRSPDDSTDPKRPRADPDHPAPAPPGVPFIAAGYGSDDD